MHVNPTLSERGGVRTPEPHGIAAHGYNPENFSNLEMLTGEFQRILNTNINTVREPIFQEDFF